MAESKFPKNFLFGAATPAHQVEGNNTNDWSEWEESPERIGDLKKRGLNPEEFISGKACDHYTRFREDFDIAGELGHTAHRFSIEWSRIEPMQGTFDEDAIAHYREVIKALRERNIEPFVTLWHWPVPLWLRDIGGVESKEFPKFFERYVHKVVSELGSEVKFWITLNEPEIYASNSYFRGKWPPRKKNVFAYLKVLHHLIQAHRFAYTDIKKLKPEAQVGIAKNNVYFEAYQNTFINRAIKFAADWWWNQYFLRRIKNYQDFIGLNHYFHNRINLGFNKNENKILSNMGWELYPEAIHEVLMDLKQYDKPVYITENGLADAKDEHRAWFIRQSLEQVDRAVSSGADVRGYLHWSLLDNFEWSDGFGPKFGLVEVDYKTLERRVRPSAWEYKKLIENASQNEA